MSYSFGNLFRVTVFGQSHSAAMGVVIDGIPPGFPVDMEAVQAFLDRRAPGQDLTTTARREPDRAEILSGLVDGRTCGAPLAACIHNTDARSQDYAKLRDVPRPMHADYPAYVKYGGYNDIRGGGQFSGRLTAPLCFAGAVAMQLLAQQDIAVGAHLAAIAGIPDQLFDPVQVTPALLEAVSKKPMAVIDDAAGAAMRARILEARTQKDSVGGVIECAVLGLPAGVGEPIYNSLESRIAAMVFSVPAVKGIEFGVGFAAAEMTGSAHNDPYYIDTDGEIRTRTNRHGGILGGISTGMPLIFRAAMKPTSSIALAQDSVSLSRLENTTLEIRGRHDPCVAVRAVPCIEAAAAAAVLDLYLESEVTKPWN